MNKKKILQKVINKIGKKRPDSMDITEEVKIKYEFDDKLKFLSFDVLLGKKNITSELPEKELKNLKDLAEDEVIDKGKKKLVFETEANLEIDFSGHVISGDGGSHWTPPSPDEIEDLEVYLGKLDIADQLSDKNLKKIKESLVDNYFPPSKEYDG